MAEKLSRSFRFVVQDVHSLGAGNILSRIVTLPEVLPGMHAHMQIVFIIDTLP